LSEREKHVFHVARREDVKIFSGLIFSFLGDDVHNWISTLFNVMYYENNELI